MNGLYVDVLTEIFESWSFITNTTCKKVLFLNEYSNVLSIKIHKVKSSKYEWFLDVLTLESRVDVGQGINVGPGKFAKKNKHRDLNEYLNIAQKVLSSSLIRQ